jgi:hypothetical protein
MKRLILVLVFCTALFSCSKPVVKSNVAPDFRPVDIKRIAVLPFAGDQGELLSDIFVTELMKLHLFDIAGKPPFEHGQSPEGAEPKVSAEEGLGDSRKPADLRGHPDGSQLDAVINGNVVTGFNMLVVNTRLVEIETGNLLWSTSYICECGRVDISDMEKAVRATVEDLERSLSAKP